jgi:regulation of enolase protein 1 (concanavalin A-like superfamily)
MRLSTISIILKTITNRVENPQGKESRFGRRDQILSFFPVFSMTVAGVDPSEVISLDQRVTGGTTKAEGIVVKVDGSTVFIKLVSVNTFIPREELSFSSDTFQNTITVGDTGVTKFLFEIPNTVAPPTYVTARNPSVPAETYDNTIAGKIVLWNANLEKLTIVNDKQPLNNDYTGRIVDSQSFTRNASVDAQLDDIFRVGDLISYPNQPEDESRFIEVSSIEYTDGVDFISEIQSKNSSGISKYVTKEVAIENPATSVNVKLTANVSDIENLKVLFKIKKSSSQENFEDIEWAYFNGTGVPDVDLIATSENAISGITEKQASYQELSYSVENLPEFSSFAVKIIMKSSNPAFVPKIQDMRAVASY